ncbi:hypothetical protein Tco_0546791 [Tanacetum coccineum]
MKRLADIKVENEKSKESLKKILNLATIRAKTQKMAKHKDKRKKVFDEYNHQITYRADLLPITKISYIPRGKFEWVLIQARALDILPPPELLSFRILMEDKKSKRTSEILQLVFVKENIVVDGMKRNLAPPLGVEVSELHLATTAQLIRLQGSIIRDTPEAEEVYNLMELEIESREDVTKAREIVKDNLNSMGQHAMKSKLSAKHQLAVKGLSECKALERNIRRIQVKDIVKEVEDHLKTYSSAEMDISWYVERIR